MLLIIQDTHRLTGPTRPGIDEGRHRALPFTVQPLLAVRSRDAGLDHIVTVTIEPIAEQPDRGLIDDEMVHEDAVNTGGIHLPATPLALRLDQARQLDLYPARQREPEVALHDEGDAALPGLAVDPNDRLIAATQVARVDRQIGDLPGLLWILAHQTLADRILMTAREGGIDQLAHPRVARVQRRAGAFLNHPDDLLRVAEVQTRIDALAVEVHRQGHDVQVAGALAVAEQGPLDPVRTRQEGQLRCSCSTAAIVVGMHRQDDRLAPRDVGREILDLVGEDIRTRDLDRRGQIHDARLLRGRLPDVQHRLADLHGIVRLGGREALGRILEGPACCGPPLRLAQDPLGTLTGDRLHAVPVLTEDPFTLDGRG